MTRYGILEKALMIRIFLVAGAFLIFSPALLAQYNFDENNQRTYQAVLSLQFAEANRLIEIEKKSDPANLLPLCFENYIDFLTLFIGENTGDYNLLKGKKSERIERLEKGSQDSPWHDFCLAEVHLQWAFARLKFGDYAAAAFEIRKAHLLFSMNETKYPSFQINKIGLGVVHVMAGIIPDSYKWIANLMGVEGSVDAGLTEIRQVAEYAGSDKITLLYKPEALFYLAFLTANLQKNKKEALPVLALLTGQKGNRQPLESPLLIFASASILMKTGHNDDALAQLQERSVLTHRYPFFYLDFLEGMTRLNKLDYSASLYFEKFTSNFKGQNYLRSACQKLAWIALLRGDTARYHQNMKLLQTKGVAVVDEDKQASAEATGNMLPNAVLLRARLLFDGGYYNQALDELLNNSLKTSVRSKRDLVEYNYRMGRIYHETGNYPKALEYYGKAIQRGRSEPYYFAASAACQMGLLYENTGAWAKADSAYRVCLSINTPEYKASLSQKAKAGLNRVKKMVPKT